MCPVQLPDSCEVRADEIEPNADLSNADLSGSNLVGANLANADLTAADLADVNLSHSNIKGTKLGCADISGAVLSDANLAFADLSEAKLKSADLSGADLESADLSGADLESADLSGADLESAALSRADLTAVDFSRTDLTAVNLDLAVIVDTNITRSNIFDSNFDLVELEYDNSRQSVLDVESPELSESNPYDTPKTWTSFRPDYMSGGKITVDFERIYIEASRQDAVNVFRELFGVNRPLGGSWGASNIFNAVESDSLREATRERRQELADEQERDSIPIAEFAKQADVCIIRVITS
jgi:uncharacterized protein YjbI with pentapeptide repeats